MQLSRSERQAINDLVGIVLDYLPGTCPYYGDPKASFQGIANTFDLGDLWKQESKKQAITNLFESTFANFRYKFCPFLYQVIDTAISVRKGRNDITPITVDEIKRIERTVSRLGLKIPELSSRDFIETLPSIASQGAQQVLSEIKAAENYTSGIETKVSGAVSKQAQTEPKGAAQSFSKISAAINKPPQDFIKKLRDELISFSRVEKDLRGYFFEAFLNKLFAAAAGRFRYPLEIHNNTISGVMELGEKTYLVEAHWEGLVSKTDIQECRQRLQEKTICSHALIVSYSGFAEDALEVLSATGGKYLLLADGRDLFMILENGQSVNRMLELKTKYAENEGRPFVSMQEIMSAPVN
jgi:hypothetical protein